MCKKEKKEKKDKKEKRAKKAQSGEAGASGAGASAAQCTLKLVEERKDLLSPVLSAPRRLLPPPRARLCLPACPPACHACSPARARRARLAVSFPPGLLPAERLTNDEETGIRLELRRNTARAARPPLSLSLRLVLTRTLTLTLTLALTR